MSEITENATEGANDPADKNNKGLIDPDTYRMRRKKNKKIWTHFDRISPHLVSCKQCKALLSCKHTSANLVRHMYLRHKVDSSLQGADKTGFLSVYAKSRVRKKDAIKSIADGNQLHEDPLAEIKKYESGLDMTNEIGKIEKNEMCIEMLDEFDHDTMNGDLHDGNTMEENNVLNEFQMELTEGRSTNMFDKEDGEKHLNSIINKTQFEIDKLRAETNYFNEMAALASAKRIMIELQTQKIRRELGVFDTKF